MMRKLAHQREVAWWSRAVEAVDASDLARLRRRTLRARELAGVLHRFLNAAENKLALPRIGSNAFYRPADADWSWRPEAFRGPLERKGQASMRTGDRIGSELAVFHDCEESDLTFRQLRNTDESDLAAYGLRLDVFDFEGTFFSLVLDLPHEAVSDISQRHLIRMDAIVESEHSVEIFARLNLQHGPNSEQIIRKLDLSQREMTLEFDLAYIDFNEARTEKIWMDFIIEGAAMNQVTIRDMTFSRTPRAEM